MGKKKRSWSTDRLLGITAMTISMITLIIFIYQTNLLRKQNYISVLPYVDIATTNNSARHNFELNVKNHGVGPAIIESLILKYQGKTYDLEDYESQLLTTLQAIAPELDSIHAVSTATLGRGMAIPANTTYQVIGVDNSPDDYELLLGTLQRLLDEGLDYDLIYRSILDERWIIHDDSDGPEAL